MNGASVNGASEMASAMECSLLTLTSFFFLVAVQFLAFYEKVHTAQAHNHSFA